MSNSFRSSFFRCLLFLAAAAIAVPRLCAAEPGEKQPAKRPIVISPNENEVSMFGVQAKGSKFVYVLDRSGSMGGSDGRALDAAKKELLASIEKLDRVQQFQIIFYNERPKIFNPTGQPGRLAFGSQQNKDEVRRFIRSVEAEGGTEHLIALMQAIRLRPDVIFLLTDADKPTLNARDLDRIDRVGGGVTIHTIEFGAGPQRDKENFLVKLAQQSAGKHVYVDSSKLDQDGAEGK